MSRTVFTSESVSEGHPDKLCDQISDAVLDTALRGDPMSRVACEVLCKTGFVVIAGEITTQTWIDFGSVARQVIRDVGYDSSEKGFDWQTCGVLIAVEPQSPDISAGVTEGQGLHKEQGAGDQGLMFGFACDETPELMPAPILYAHALTRRLSELRRSGELPWLRPDAKSQVTVAYDGDRPVGIEAVVLSTQHAPEVTHKQIVEAVQELVIQQVLPRNLLKKTTKYYVNPTGRFVIGGPFGDAGLTGRKIIVDTYGGMGRHGGGAFSGKDPSKVDRSAAYYARYIAKNLVAAGVARRIEVQIAYAIGVARPMGVFVNSFGTGKVSDDVLQSYVSRRFDMRPKAIIDELGLLAPIYRATATYGHFGRPEFAWEVTDRAAEIADDLLGGVRRGSRARVEAAPGPASPKRRSEKARRAAARATSPRRKRREGARDEGATGRKAMPAPARGRRRVL